jgi:hypothetical protein
MQPSSDAKGVNLPPLEKGNYRVVTGDNQIYDVPVESIEQAQQFDADLRVLSLNPYAG